MQDEYGIHYSYDSRGNLEGIQFLDFGYYYSYDDANRLIEAKTHSNPLQKGIGFGYNANGLVEEINTPHNIKTLYGYDDASQLIRITQQNIQTHTLTHKRDKLGRVQQIIDESQEEPQEYSYDQRGALIEEMQGSSVQQYHYDSAGNRISAPLEEETHRYNSSNQLIEDSLYLYGYDSRGNLHTKEDKHTQETLVYTFNLFDQLIQIRRYKANLQQVLLEQWDYSYDALNRRVTKTYTNHEDATQDYSHRYLYHEDAIVAILDSELNILATLLHHPSQVDTPLSITNELTGETYYYHSNHQGSITHLTNEDGESIERFTYDAYGTILEYSQEEETFNPYCYTAREFDVSQGSDNRPCLAVHGLYYYRARYYDARIGRFISSDPIEFKSRDFNWYRYVNNDPVNHTDPSGLFDPVADAILAPTVDLDKAVEQTDNLFDTMLMLTGIGALAKTLFKEGMALLGKSGIKVVKGTASKKVKLSNDEVRDWYNKKVKDIETDVKPTRENAKKISEERAKLKKEARDLMADEKAKASLPSIKEFEYYEKKYSNPPHNLSGEDLYDKIINQSKITNKEVNSKYGSSKK